MPAAQPAEFGFESGYEAVNFYYGASDWTDTPSPMLRDAEKAAMLPAATQPTLESHIYITDTTEGRKLVANPYFHQVDTTGQQLPYISRQDEVYKNDNEVRILALVNGEVDYKAQSVQLPSAPDPSGEPGKGGYTIQLKPTIAFPTFSFNVTSLDEAKREVFNSLDFRKAMSAAINRDELNEVAYFGQGEAMAYTGFSPLPEFAQAFGKVGTDYDPEGANAALDALGMADTDGDGFRELPTGDPVVLNMQFATQGIAGEVVEMVAQNWADVGIQTAVKEVTPDEYRAAQSANELDVHMWQRGQPVAIILGSNEEFVPPFSSYFGHRTGMKWAEWLDSDGSAGIEPPQFVKDMVADVAAFQEAVPGSDEAKRQAWRTPGQELCRKHAVHRHRDLAPAPIYVNNSLKNVPEFQTWSYEYYRTYPYRGTQWFLEQ